MSTKMTITSTEYISKLGTSDFNKLVMDGDLFVDKTSFIADVMYNDCKSLTFTRHSGLSVQYISY